MADKFIKTSVSTAATNNCLLETTKADRHVWLMKCPREVAQAMQITNHQNTPPHAASDGPIVAKVIVAIDLRPDQDSTQFTMELNGTGETKAKYTMDLSTDFVPMTVLSESSQGKPSVEGKIHHRFDMKPHEDYIEDYRKLCRQRKEKSMTRTRQIQVIDNDNGMRMRPMLGMFDVKSFGSTEKKVQAKGSEAKRTRRDPEEMEKIMFKLFERQSNWTLKQLVQKTDQPEQFLKDMLKLLCVYNNKGANQGTYELKPEYRRSDDNPDTQ